VCWKPQYKPLKSLHRKKITLTVVNISPSLNVPPPKFPEIHTPPTSRKVSTAPCNRTQEGCIEKKSLLVKRSLLRCMKGKHLQ